MSATILTYHHVADAPPGHPQKNLFISPREFNRQMDFLKQDGFHVMSLDLIKNSLTGGEPLPHHTVAITFDDGFEDIFQNAFPILSAHGFTATIFVITGTLGAAVSQRDTSECERYLSAEHLRALSAADITIGSHSTAHRRLGNIPLDEATEEIVNSRKVLEEILGRPVTWFSYPFGSFNSEVARCVRNAGYAGAVSVIRDNRVKPSQVYYLPRVMVMPDATLLRFRYYFSALYHIIHRIKNRRRWGEYA